MAGSGLPAIRNGYQQPSGAHANGRGLPNDDIRHRVTEIRCCGTENRFSTLTISAVGERRAGTGSATWVVRSPGYGWTRSSPYSPPPVFRRGIAVREPVFSSAAARPEPPVAGSEWTG